jgi:hypothetical protein
MNDTNRTAKAEEEDVTSVILSIVMVKKTNMTVKIVSAIGCFNSVCERRHMKTNDSQSNLPLQGRMNRDLKHHISNT